MTEATTTLTRAATPEYGNGWLQIQDGGKEISFPKRGDPYGEVYTVRGKWWSMCDDQLVNPLNREAGPKERQAKVDAEWTAFAKLIIESVKLFHAQVKNRYHPNTHAFFGSHTDHKAYGKVTWSGSRGLAGATLFKDRPVDVLDARQLTSAELKEQELPEPEIKRMRTVDALYTDGGWFPHSQRSYFISEPDEPGDGTVPHRSGISPMANCKAFLQVKVGHEPAYNLTKGPDNLRACRFTLRSIVKIAQGVSQTSLKYE